MLNADTPLLRFTGLTGGYHDTPVLRDLDGAVGAGQTLGVLGRNGVGKTTLLRLLMGYLQPFSGEIYWHNKVINNVPTYKRNQLGISYAPQEHAVFDDLSVRDNLVVHLPSPSLAPYDSYFEAFPRLAQRLHQRAGTLSGGEKKLLSFTRALAEGSTLILLDEPTEGVQEENIQLMAQLIRVRMRQGAAFLIVEQNLSFLEAIMDEVLVLDHGRCVARGSASRYTRETLASYLQV